MPELTQEKIDKYVKDRGGYCPFCGSDQYEGGSLDFDSGRIYQRMLCNECGEDWMDAYHLANVL